MESVPIGSAVTVAHPQLHLGCTATRVVRRCLDGASQLFEGNHDLEIDTHRRNNPETQEEWIQYLTGPRDAMGPRDVLNFVPPPTPCWPQLCCNFLVTRYSTLNIEFGRNTPSKYCTLQPVAFRQIPEKHNFRADLNRISQ